VSVRTHLRVVAAVVLATSPFAANAQVSLANAWMRPAAAGQKEAQVYVDIRAAEPVKLVSARTPAAKRAELVLLDPPQPDTGKLRVVREIAVPANQETRLAYRGSHVRLLELQRAANPGEKLPLELTFVDAKGKRTSLATDVLVRGLVARRPDGAEPPQPPPAK
jgi:periplasmic copper chaperone A